MKARGALYIPTYEYNYKVITRCDTILQEYYITDNTKKCTSMNCTNSAHEITEGKLKRRAGAWKDRVLDGLSVIHATAVPLWSATGRIYKLQTLRPGHEYPGESKLPSEW